MFQRTVSGMVLVSVFVAASTAFAGKVELTTYYPAPYGEYSTVKLSPRASAPAACTATNKGTMYYDSTANAPLYCDGVAWSALGSGGASAVDIYLGGYTRPSWTWVGGSGGDGWRRIDGGWTIDYGSRAAVCPNCATQLHPSPTYFAFRVNFRLLPAGSYTFNWGVDVDIDQTSGTTEVPVQLHVDRASWAAIDSSEYVADDNDSAPYATNPALPVTAGTGHFPVGACLPADLCTTTRIDRSFSLNYTYAGDKDTFRYYRIVVWRKNSRVAVRIRNVSLTVTRAGD